MNPTDHFLIDVYFDAPEDLARWGAIVAPLLDPDIDLALLEGLGEWRGQLRRHRCSAGRPGRPAGGSSGDCPGKGNSCPTLAVVTDDL